jgi:D-arabinose 1-dehydrogenase-like Zn-dependent alcohol dehydrogenase
MGFDVGEFQLCAACGVCHSDLHVINKDQPYPIPCVLGHEITGEVVEHGKHTDPATVKRFGSYALTLQVHHAMFPFKYSHQNRRG